MSDKIHTIRKQRRTKRGTPKCRWCGRPVSIAHGVRGVMGKGMFHSNACAMNMAAHLVTLLDAGKTLAVEE